MDEQLTLPRIRAQLDHWNRFPPVHLALAAALGSKERLNLHRDKHRPFRENQGDLESFIGVASAMGIPIKRRKKKKGEKIEGIDEPPK